jgi:hypothetical protein
VEFCQVFRRAAMISGGHLISFEQSNGKQGEMQGLGL